MSYGLKWALTVCLSVPELLPLLPGPSGTEPGIHRDGSNSWAFPTVNREAVTETVHPPEVQGVPVIATQISHFRPTLPNICVCASLLGDRAPHAT